MKGIELAESFFNLYGKPMLENEFSDITDKLACGIAGSGSECFGFDDEISTDHDFEAGFCIFLPGEDIIDRRTEFLLERAYAKLPKEFGGVKRGMLSPVGGARRGVIRTGDFFNEKVGCTDGNLTVSEWLTLPEQSLAEATNGKIFFDNFGEVTKIREKLAYFPDDIRLKKLAGNLLLMAQSGQYNYKRSVDRGELAAAQLAVFEFVKHAASVIFLLNGVYEPYYKWCFKALRALPKLSIEAEIMEYLITTDNSPDLAKEKYYAIEGVAADVIDELQNQKLTKAVCGDLEKHAYSVNDTILDSNVRNLHVLSAV
ncbi:MAG: DUF4037 domain-containing protein [Clostridia bacterium]|nr:DUF4037 domain-containing protein [Clostridia bacterium]